MSVPIGNNTLNALGVFKEREKYFKEVYPKIKQPPIDVWYDRPLYGKIDQNGIPLFPSEVYFRQIHKEKPIYVLDFVADAFNAFQNYLEQQKVYKRVQDTEILKTTPENGWVDPKKMYYDYFNIIYNVFLEQNYKIRSFHDFVKKVVFLLEKISASYPITFSSFICSGICPNEISGLVIHLQQKDFGEDKDKYETFIQDPSYQKYVDIAAKFGFIVDKNAPWRLFADVFSAPMRQYLKKYNKEPGLFFEKYFYNAFEVDIEYLKVYLIQSYITLLPSLKIRQEETFESIDKKTPAKFWLRLYLFLKILESGAKLTQEPFNNLVNNIELTVKNKGKQKAMNVVSKMFSKRTYEKDLTKLPTILLTTNSISNIKFFEV